MNSSSLLRPRALALAALAALLLPGAASAEWFISPFIGIKFASDTNIVLGEGANKTRMTLGGSAAILTDGILGVEGEFGYSPRFFERPAGSGDLVARSNVTTLMGNVLFAVPKSITRDGLRPYGVAGVGLIHVGLKDIVNVFDVDGDLLGMTIGVGAIGQITTRTSLRFDVRHIRNIGRTDGDVPSIGETQISYWRATAGVAFSSRLF